MAKVWKCNGTIQIDEDKLNQFFSHYDKSEVKNAKAAIVRNKELINAGKFDELLDVGGESKLNKIWVGNEKDSHGCFMIVGIVVAMLIKNDIDFLSKLNRLEHHLFQTLYFITGVKVPRNIAEIYAYFFETYSESLDIYLPNNIGMTPRMFGNNPHDITVHAEDTASGKWFKTVQYEFKEFNKIKVVGDWKYDLKV